MRRSPFGLPIFAAVVALSALGLVVFGVLALDRALHNAQAAASQEARSAAISAVRALRARVDSRAFRDQLTAPEQVRVSSSQVIPPTALPGRELVIDADFVTQSALDYARVLEFSHGKPDEALAHLDATLARPDRSGRDRARLCSSAMWIAERAGKADVAASYRARIGTIKTLAPRVAARVALYDVRHGTAMTSDVIEKIAQLEDGLATELIATMRRHVNAESDDATSAFERLGIAKLAQRVTTVARLRRAYVLVRRRADELRAASAMRAEGVRTKYGDETRDEVLVWSPASSERSGSAWLLPLAKFVEATRDEQSGDVSDENEHGFTLTCGDPPVNSITVFAGLHAVPTETAALTEPIDGRMTQLLLLALATTFALAMWLMLRAFRRERTALAARSEFLRSITHELRTPLASIRLFAETLASGRFRSEASRDEYTELIAAEAGRLSTLVENALELGRTERGERTWSFEATRVDELTQESVELFRPLARESSMEIELVTFDEVSASVDRDGLRQVLWNLFDNARKYASTGGRIDIELIRQSETAVLRVRDYGPGIDSAERATIFDRFVRGKQQRDGGTPGAGLGLAIARSIVSAHGGTLDYEIVDGGACFVVRLPIAHPERRST